MTHRTGDVGRVAGGRFFVGARSGWVGVLIASGGCASAPAAVRAVAPAVVAPPAPVVRADIPRSYAVLDSGPSRLTIFLATTRRAVASDRLCDRYGPDDADSLQSRGGRRERSAVQRPRHG